MNFLEKSAGVSDALTQDSLPLQRPRGLTSSSSRASSSVLSWNRVRSSDKAQVVMNSVMASTSASESEKKTASASFKNDYERAVEVTGAMREKGINALHKEDNSGFGEKTITFWLHHNQKDPTSRIRIGYQEYNRPVDPPGSSLWALNKAATQALNFLRHNGYHEFLSEGTPKVKENANQKLDMTIRKMSEVGYRIYLKIETYNQQPHTYIYFHEDQENPKNATVIAKGLYDKTTVSANAVAYEALAYLKDNGYNKFIAV